jgi:hypothetical protein
MLPKRRPSATHGMLIHLLATLVLAAPELVNAAQAMPSAVVSRWACSVASHEAVHFLARWQAAGGREPVDHAGQLLAETGQQVLA